MTIPDNVTEIGNFAFRGCTGLESVTIGNGIMRIGDATFAGCTDLTDVYYSGSEAEWSAVSINSGNDCLTNATIHYNSQGPAPVPTLIPVTTAEIVRIDAETDAAYTFEVDAVDKYESCYVYVAVYDADSVLINVKRVPLETAGETVVSVSKNEKDAEAKVFIWSDNTQPIITAEKFILK